MPELPEQGAERLASLVRAAEVSAVEVVRAALARIARVDPLLGAFLDVREADALDEAAALDERRAAGETLGPLAGVPIALKDNLSLAGGRVSCGSRILEGYVAPYTATAVERLVAAGAIVVGKTNLDEFAMGSSCENSAFHPTRNPWDLSLDQIGPLTRHVRDAALALGVMAGHDAADATSSTQPVGDYLARIEDGIRGLRIGVVREVDAAGLAPDVRRSWESTLATLRGLGADLVEVSVPSLGAAIAIYYVLANCEASANLARFDGVRYGRRDAAARDLLATYVETRSAGFGAEVKRRIMLGTFALSSGYAEEYYGRARGVLEGLRAQFDAAFEQAALLVTPTSPTGAFALGEKLDDPLTMYLSDVYTVPANLVGLPAVAVPSGADARGLPLSLQILARPFDEATAFRAARAFEAATSWRCAPEFRGAPAGSVPG
jgi:aspartyl-tRNA(Asn)/glutamyl-tRNA(Gln) amidotransferase subunit A